MKNGLTIKSNGTKVWYKNGFLHRLDGPAVIWSDGEEWWYKNGDSKNEIYFGVPFVKSNGKNATFYPDFIVKYTNGKIGIFDTKKGNTAESEDTRLKAEALQKYIKQQGENLFGGILIPSDKQGNVWKLNQEDKYDYKNGNWEILE